MPKLEPRDPTQHPLASVVNGFMEEAYALNGKPPGAVVSALDTLAFAPFASKLRALGGARTPLQETLQKNHERAVELLSNPDQLLQATGQLIKSSAQDLLAHAKHNMLAYVRPQAQAADWLLNTRWSADGLAARRDEFVDSVKTSLATHARETRAFGRSLRAGESAAFKDIGAFLAVAATTILNPNKIAVFNKIDGLQQVKKVPPSSEPNKPLLLITDKRAEDFAKTMREEGWGELDTRFLFPYEFGDQVLADMRRAKFPKGKITAVDNFKNTDALNGKHFLSEPTVMTFRGWKDYVWESSKDLIPGSENLEFGDLLLGWNYVASREIKGRRIGGHVDMGFMTVSVNLKHGQSTWTYPGAKTPRQVRIGGEFIDSDQFNNLHISPNRKTSLWSGQARTDVDPMLHTSPLMALLEGEDRVTALMAIKVKKPTTNLTTSN